MNNSNNVRFMDNVEIRTIEQKTYDELLEENENLKKNNAVLKHELHKIKKQIKLWRQANQYKRETMVAILDKINYLRYFF